MCMIVDIPAVHKIFPLPNPDFVPVHRHLMSGRARIVYGGKIRREYLRIEWFRRLLLRLDQQGSARRISDGDVDAATKEVRSLRICASNDCHIIALARVGRVRLLCTDDQRLMKDFKNKKLLDKPRGNIYRNDTHAYLLRKHCGDAC